MKKNIMSKVLFLAMTCLVISSCNEKKSDDIKNVDKTEKALVVEPAPEVEEVVTERIPPFSVHGALFVNGADLVDSNGQMFQLRGMSTHGIGWFPDFINPETFKYLRDGWNTNCIRLAMYTDESAGYCTSGDKEKLKNLVKNGVQYATDLGMYVIIDWHVLNDRNPLKYVDEAVSFFDEMSKLYSDYDNVIYEICNEPNGTSWESVKEYANTVIPVIRDNSENAVIIVGTTNWSQDIDVALDDPLDYPNIMYALHFYAATHKDWLRQRMKDCRDDGLPIFISEFGICDASGNGAVDLIQAELWKDMIEEFNISYMCWNLANKNESSSILKATTSSKSKWKESELNKQGIWVSQWFKSEEN